MTPPLNICMSFFKLTGKTPNGVRRRMAEFKSAHNTLSELSPISIMLSQFGSPIKPCYGVSSQNRVMSDRVNTTLVLKIASSTGSHMKLQYVKLNAMFCF
jgi:hypothetical protein